MADPLTEAEGLVGGGRFAEAGPLLESLCERDPASARAWFLLGACRHALGAHAPALEAFDRTLALNPADLQAAQAAQAAVAVLCDSGQHRPALDRCRKLLAQFPGVAQLHFNTGVVYEALGEPASALRHYDEALGLDPSLFGALQNRAVALTAQGRLDEAVQSNRRFVQAYPQSVEAHYNLAETCVAAGLYDEAIRAADQALAIQPDHLPSILDRGFALAASGRIEEARRDLKRVVAHRDSDLGLRMAAWASRSGITEDLETLLQPEDIFILTGCERLERCDWTDYDGFAARCADLIASAREGALRSRSLAFQLLHLPLSPAAQRMVAEKIAGGVEREVVKTPKFPAPRSSAGRRLRIGYLSANFGNHATSHLTQGIYGLHDRRRFEVFGYALVADDHSALYRTIAANCDEFSDLHRLSSEEIAGRIAAQSIDILVDLNGYTRRSRSEILAMRPAPVQACYVAYPATLGGRLVDYLIADGVVIPPGADRFYAEKIIRLPHCYQPNAHRQVSVLPTPTRHSEALPERGFVFCAFHRHEKIDPRVFSTWMRILKSVPGSVLWLQQGDGEPNLRRHAADAGIEPGRLLFARPRSIEEHLARLRLADLFLDTLQYNAHTMGTDALWAGVPLVSCPGKHFVSRVASSLLRAVGLDELAVDSCAAYEALAIQLATSPAKLGQLRSRLEQNRASYPLFDTGRLVRNLERAYLHAWHLHESGASPESFGVSEPGGSLA